MKTMVVRKNNTAVRTTVRLTLLTGLLLGVFLAPPALAQVQENEKTTEDRLRELREQIALDEQRLNETEQAERASLETLRDLDREMAIRKELTSNYQDRLAELVDESDSLRASLDVLEQDLGVLKTQYQRRAVHAYKYGRLHDLALILSASSINQMLIRARYLNRFTDERRDKLQAIQDAATDLEDRRLKLAEARVQTQLLLSEAQKEQQRMQSLQQNRRGVIQELQTQKTTLSGELSKKREAATEFERRIRDVIATETARRRSEAKPQDEVNFQGLTGSFFGNRGNLPWPASGVVVEPYGDVVNPIHGTTTPNPGVLIATKPQAEVRSIFDGTVLSVSVIPEFGTYVAIAHGEYQSVYSNFSMVYIAEGSSVKAGAIIGRAGTDAEPKEAGIFFGLFKDGTPFDPMPWLRSR